jgi:hypothetical protein
MPLDDLACFPLLADVMSSIAPKSSQVVIITSAMYLVPWSGHSRMCMLLYMYLRHWVALPGRHGRRGFWGRPWCLAFIKFIAQNQIAIVHLAGSPGILVELAGKGLQGGWSVQPTNKPAKASKTPHNKIIEKKLPANLSGSRTTASQSRTLISSTGKRGLPAVGKIPVRKCLMWASQAKEVGTKAVQDQKLNGSSPTAEQVEFW